MTVYSVFERPDEIAPAVVPDAFSWGAAILPPFHAVLHGLWAWLAIWLVAVALLVAAGFWLGPDAAVSLYLLFALWIGFEAPALRRNRLLRKGWSWRADLIAAGPDLAQRDWLRMRSVAA